MISKANETVGTIDDLVVTPSEKVPFAVLSVGDFLGMGTKYVVVPHTRGYQQTRRSLTRGSCRRRPALEAWNRE
jgi:hypothetical protein